MNIPIPENLTAGTVCFDYCIYDSENNVSNIVEVCVEVLPFGGEGAEFLFEAKGWEPVYYIDVIDGISDTTVFTGTYTDTEYVTVACGDSTASVVVELEQPESIIWSFGANGGFAIEYSSDGEYIDEENSTCDDIQTYTVVDDYEEYFSGGWSYSANASRIQIIISNVQYSYEEDGVVIEEEETYIQIIDAEVSREGELLILRFSYEGESDENVIVLQPKQ